MVKFPHSSWATYVVLPGVLVTEGWNKDGKGKHHISAAQGSTCSFRAANSKGVACLASVITFSLSARAWRRRRTTSKCPAKAAMCKGVVPWSVPEFRTVYDFKKLEGCLFKLIYLTSVSFIYYQNIQAFSLSITSSAPKPSHVWAILRWGWRNKTTSRSKCIYITQLHQEQNTL